MKSFSLIFVVIFNIATFSAQAASVDERLSILERTIKGKNQSEYQMQERLDRLQQEIQELRGLNETQAKKIEDITNRQKGMYQKLASLEANLTKQPDKAVVSGTLDETSSYENAVNLVLEKKDFDAAIPAFQSFISKYPKSDFAANANYWLGQLLFNKGQYKDAKGAFNKVKDYPDSGKKAEASLKLGLIAEKTGNPNDAKAIYQKVQKDYPKSTAAKQATKYLSELK